MVLACRLDTFSSHRSVYFTGGQDPVLFIKEDQFSQMPGKQRNLSLKSPISSAILLWSMLPFQPVGHLICAVGRFNFSQGERASHFLSIHPSVRGDLLFLTAPEGFLVVLFLLASATFPFYHICCWLLPVCCSLQLSAKANILSAARGSLDWHIIKGSKGHISRLK